MDEKPPVLEKAEYLALIDQKAADWRAITQMSTSFLAFSGALFAAGVSQKASFVVILAPVPLLFGVYHMVRNAILQLQMITYLAVFSPFEGVSWERDINCVRPQFWERSRSSKLAARIRKGTKEANEARAEWARWFEHPSSWQVWLLITFVIGVFVDLLPLMAEEFKSACTALVVGLAILATGTWIVARRATAVERIRKEWVAEWERHRRGLSSPGS